MISAADRESAYVIDGLMHNDVVKSDIHSTDTHGYTEAVFGLTHLLGFSFAPRIKGIGKQRLYLFRGHDRADREGWTIAPAGYANDALIRENWDDLLRLVATIKLKENTASDIFRRLNSYSRQHALYQTLKAFGQIVKSLFILRYLDDLDLRQAIEKQLNKVELANRLSRQRPGYVAERKLRPSAGTQGGRRCFPHDRGSPNELQTHGRRAPELLENGARPNAASPSRFRNRAGDP